MLGTHIKNTFYYLYTESNDLLIPTQQFDFNINWISCDQCGDWWHSMCTGQSLLDDKQGEEAELFHCLRCVDALPQHIHTETAENLQGKLASLLRAKVSLQSLCTKHQ